MRSLERSGVTLERCSDCGGVFLDRGELERLADAELGAGEAPASAPAGGGAAAASATPAPAPGSSSQALMGDLMNLARQYKGGRSKF